MHDVRAKKHLGQHFLNDEEIAKRIVDSFLQSAQDNMVEVGPGTGVLTKYLIEKKNFFAIDVDNESIAYLKKTYPEHQQKIIYGDFLHIDIGKLFPGNFSVIGNFPYNISSQIMFKVLDNKERVDVIVGMFQKEVAERLAEKPGTKIYGILSVLLQAFYEIEYLFTVEPGAFTPPPKVRSAVIRLTRNKTQSLGCDEKLFKAIIKSAFNQRRKMMRNSLKGFVKDEILFTHKHFINRPEQLSVADFVELTKMIENQK